MVREVPFRALVAHAVGGGWGADTPAAGTTPVRVIRGTDFANVAAANYGAIPRRFEAAKKAARRLLKPDDIVLEISGGSKTSGQTTGRSLLVTQSLLERLGEQVIPASFCRLIRLDHETIVPRYAYYALQEMYLSGRAGLYEHHSTGISNFQFEFFLDQEVVRLPELSEQRAIAHILGTLDDKIDLNRRMSKTLEEMARTLFDRAFSETDAPESPCGDLYTVGIGKTPPRMESEWFTTDPADMPWMSIRDMGSCGVFIRNTAERLTGSAVERFRIRTIPDYTVVVSFKLTVGRVAITVGEMLSNEAIAHLVPKADTYLTTEYLYCFLGKFDYGRLGSTSSIATAVNSDSIRALPARVPPRDCVASFTDQVRPTFHRIRALGEESETLARLRDLLLPKLISGELRVKDAERLAEAAPA